MNAARALRWARRRAGLTQRQLSEKAGVPQSTVGRIEAGTTDPRVQTLSQLLRACGFDMEVEPRLGVGVDRTLIRETLMRTPEQRIQYIAPGARWLATLKSARRVAEPGA